jgi:hypothetical protein
MAEHIKNLSAGLAPGGTTSERAAFAALLSQQGTLGISEVYQCDGLFADGYLVDAAGRKIPVEIKETLGWPQLHSACFQLVSMNTLKEFKATEAWIIYEKLSKEWNDRHNEAAIEHANKCIASFRVGLEIKFVHLLPNGQFKHTGGVRGAA